MDGCGPMTRRQFLGGSTSLGAVALASLAGRTAFGRDGGRPGVPHFPPKARRVIYLCQSGAPSQMDLFDYKPKLTRFRGKDLPDSVRRGQRLPSTRFAS